VGLLALVQAVLAVVAPAPAPPQQPPDGEPARLTARQKAALVVVSGLSAPPGVAGVLVRSWDRTAPRPPGALVFVDQEGGAVRAFPELPPVLPAASYESAAQAAEAGRAAGDALRAAGVHVDLAPVVDLATGPLGPRHFRDPELALAFARGLEAGGTAACPKHFPGLGTAAVSTDDAPRVRARVRARELGAFRAAVRAGARCVMLGHAFYGRFGSHRALTSPAAYRLLRRLGFEGVAMTDSLSVVRGRWPVRWARRAALAGADLLLFTSPQDARRGIRALVPLAHRGQLDDAVRRVLRLRRSLGIADESGW
jgi:beta-N-acetylhexosaminidase